MKLFWFSSFLFFVLTLLSFPQRVSATSLSDKNMVLKELVSRQGHLYANMTSDEGQNFLAPVEIRLHSLLLKHKSEEARKAYGTLLEKDISAQDWVNAVLKWAPFCNVTEEYKVTTTVNDEVLELSKSDADRLALSEKTYPCRVTLRYEDFPREGRTRIIADMSYKRRARETLVAESLSMIKDFMHSDDEVSEKGLPTQCYVYDHTKLSSVDTLTHYSRRCPAISGVSGLEKERPFQDTVPVQKESNTPPYLILSHDEDKMQNGHLFQMQAQQVGSDLFYVKDNAFYICDKYEGVLVPFAYDTLKEMKPAQSCHVVYTKPTDKELYFQKGTALYFDKEGIAKVGGGHFYSLNQTKLVPLKDKFVFDDKVVLGATQPLSHGPKLILLKNEDSRLSEIERLKTYRYTHYLSHLRVDYRQLDSEAKKELIAVFQARHDDLLWLELSHYQDSSELDKELFKELVEMDGLQVLMLNESRLSADFIRDVDYDHLSSLKILDMSYTAFGEFHDPEDLEFVSDYTKLAFLSNVDEQGKMVFHRIFPDSGDGVEGRWTTIYFNQIKNQIEDVCQKKMPSILEEKNLLSSLIQLENEEFIANEKLLEEEMKQGVPAVVAKERVSALVGKVRDLASSYKEYLWPKTYENFIKGCRKASAFQMADMGGTLTKGYFDVLRLEQDLLTHQHSANSSATVLKEVSLLLTKKDLKGIVSVLKNSLHDLLTKKKMDEVTKKALENGDVDSENGVKIVYHDITDKGYKTTKTIPVGSPVSALCFNEDGSLLASASEGCVELWSVKNGELKKHYTEQQKGPIEDLGFSKDGELLHSYGSRDHKVWEVNGKKRLALETKSHTPRESSSVTLYPSSGFSTVNDQQLSDFQIIKAVIVNFQVKTKFTVFSYQGIGSYVANKDYDFERNGLLSPRTESNGDLLISSSEKLTAYFRDLRLRYVVEFTLNGKTISVDYQKDQENFYFVDISLNTVEKVSWKKQCTPSFSINKDKDEYYVGCTDKTLRAVSKTTGETLKSYPYTGDVVVSLGRDEKNKTLVALTTDGVLNIFDVEGERTQTYMTGNDVASFSYDSKHQHHKISYKNGLDTLWDFKTGKKLFDSCTAYDNCHDKKKAIGTQAGEIKIFEDISYEDEQ